MALGFLSTQGHWRVPNDGSRASAPWVQNVHRVCLRLGLIASTSSSGESSAPPRRRLVAVRSGELGGSYGRALHAGFCFARELGQPCGPVHLLVGVAEGDGPAAAALSAGAAPSLRSVVTRDRELFAEEARNLQLQAQGAATMFADRRGEQATAEHLLVALLDQCAPAVVEAMGRAAIDQSAARAAALSALGTSPGLGPVELPPPSPAGTMGRPPLPVGELDPRAWAVLRWRQEHLPLERLRRRSDWVALSRMEWSTAWRLGSGLGVDDDQLHSLAQHHADEVERVAALVKPGLVTVRRRTAATVTAVPLIRKGRHRHRRPRVLNFTYGWGTWFKNRHGGMQYRWFRLRTARYYRGAPQP
jgi:hypothetical protein